MKTASKVSPAVPALVGPVVVAVRGPSRSGKTALVERLIETGRERGWKVAWVKRTHHQVDLPEKASGRIWTSGPEVMVLHAADRVQVTTPACAPDSSSVLARVPEGMDLVLLETHTPEAFPTILSNLLEPAEGEDVIGRFELYGNQEAAVAAIPLIARMIPSNARLDAFLRQALRLHGGHGCAGLVLGTRLAMAGADALGIAAPDLDRRLVVVSETDRCALDGIQAVTGCRVSKHTLRLLDYGKVAATFIDEWTASAVRVGVRGDLRERVGPSKNADDRHIMQRQAYGTWAAADLFEVRTSGFTLPEFDRPGSPRRRVLCGACGEEVSDGREVATVSGARCQPCAEDLANRGA
ncbi:MAG: molybdopterin-guanine dinucleotide biosynthesis protein MobB [Anaerolineaceae bacterium]